MKYVIVDLEMNPVAKEYVDARKYCHMEVIEIGAVILDEAFLVLGEFKTLVKPQFNSEIVKRYETLTGISTQMVSEAPDFPEAYDMFVSWCGSYGDDYEIYAWSENDRHQIIAEMAQKNYTDEEKKKPLSQWYDFQKEYAQKLGVDRIMSLEKALDYAGVTFEGQMHDALCDARNTAELFAIVRNEERCKMVLKSVMEAFQPKKVSGTLGEMFDFGALMTQLQQ